jgi:hypothetical protein
LSFFLNFAAKVQKEVKSEERKVKKLLLDAVIILIFLNFVPEIACFTLKILRL